MARTWDRKFKPVEILISIISSEFDKNLQPVIIIIGRVPNKSE